MLSLSVFNFKVPVQLKIFLQCYIRGGTILVRYKGEQVFTSVHQVHARSVPRLIRQDNTFITTATVFLFLNMMTRAILRERNWAEYPDIVAFDRDEGDLVRMP